MSRYIDAEQLWKYADNQKDKSISANDFMRFPYIDIVRCKECKHWHKHNNFTGKLCLTSGAITKPDDFCSYGEREGE